MNQSVVAALRDRVAELVGHARALTLAETITTRQKANRFPPEYQAEVIVRRLHKRYFYVLQCLDSETPNDVHLGIAALAKANYVPAVLTTNFDRALEAAFRKLAVPFNVISQAGQFRSLADRFSSDDGSHGPCTILKLHGSAEDPDTLVDTLSQRKRGFQPAVAQCIRHLLRFGHWLFLGYSGADLMADENYLYLKPDASDARGFTWLLRTNTQPVSALSAIRDIYADRAEIVHSELPGWLVEFSQSLLSEPVRRLPALSGAQADEIRRRATDQVAEHVRSWAASERSDRIVLVFADLLDAVGEPSSSLELVQRLYDTCAPQDRRSGHFGVVINALANHYSQRGRFAEAISLFQEALTIYDSATAEKQYVGTLNNLALVYEKQGQTSEALTIYKRALGFAEKSGDVDAHGVALHNLAMIQEHFGEKGEAERLYEREMDIVRRLGDEPARATALNNLGELAVSNGQFDRAAAYLKEAVSVRDRIGDDLGSARSRANLANAHRHQKEYEQALWLYEQSLSVFRRFSERADIARTLANIARLKESTGKRDEALERLDEALSEATSAGADPVRAVALQLLGEIQHKEGRLKEAAETFRALLQLAVRIRDVQQERDALFGRGFALKELNETDVAIPLLRDALTLTDRHGFGQREWVMEHLTDTLNRDGLARQQQGDLEGALQRFREAVEIRNKRGSPFNEGLTWMNLGNTQAMLKRYVEAASSFQLAEASLSLANDRNSADIAGLSVGEMYLWLDRLDDAEHVFRTIVYRTTTYEERAQRMNRIGEFAEKQLQGGWTNRALRVLEDCFTWNRDDGYLPDAAACLINIGCILNAAGDIAGGQSWLQKAVILLKDQPQHPLLQRVKVLLSAGSVNK
jgi:tetratricopeptide (TPR) repeat protein